MNDLIYDNFYTPFILNLIKDSNKSIFGFIFHARSSIRDVINPVNLIFNSLIEARKRGVFISLCFSHYGLSRQMRGDNLSSCDILHKSNIECFVCTSKILLHSKFFIFDKNSLISGSHNLSLNSLAKNFETSIYSDDSSLVSKYFSYFNTGIVQCEQYGKSL